MINNEIQIICATIIHGMGIDKADVRVVFHYKLSADTLNANSEGNREG